MVSSIKQPFESLLFSYNRAYFICLKFSSILFLKSLRLLIEKKRKVHWSDFLNARQYVHDTHGRL